MLIGLTHTAGVQQVFYYFNMSHVDSSDTILQAELRLFKLRPAPQVRRALRRLSRPRSQLVADVSSLLHYFGWPVTLALLPILTGYASAYLQISLYNAQYTPHTPTRLSCRVESRRSRRCEQNSQLAHDDC